MCAVCFDLCVCVCGGWGGGGGDRKNALNHVNEDCTLWLVLAMEYKNVCEPVLSVSEEYPLGSTRSDSTMTLSII